MDEEANDYLKSLKMMAQYLQSDQSLATTESTVIETTISTICNMTAISLSGDTNAGQLCNNSASVLDDDSDAIDKMANVLSIVVPILFGIIVIVGLFGNALVVIVVACNPQMRSTTNLLIINLAIADLLFIVFCVPFTAWDYAFTFWPFGNVWCKIVQYLIVVCAYASIYTLVLMSLDRYLAVAHPIQSMSIRTERNAYLAIFLMWITIIMACIPAFISHRVITFENSDSVCLFSLEEYNQSLYQICFFLSSYVIPIFIILVLYVLMLKRLWFGAVPGGHMSAESVRSKKRVTRMVVVVVIIFACSWCPIQLVLVLKSFGHYEIDTKTLIIQIAAHILAYMNSCVNPILYAFLSENFRKAFHKVIVCNSNARRTLQIRNDLRMDRETTMMNTCTTKTINGNV